MILDFPGIPLSGNDLPLDIPVLATAAGIQLDNDDDNDEGVEDGHNVELCIELSKKSCKCLHYYVIQITLIGIKYSETYLPRSS